MLAHAGIADAGLHLAAAGPKPCAGGHPGAILRAMSAKWILPAEKPEAAERLARDLRIARLTARLLLNRGLSDAGIAGTVEVLHRSL